MDEIEFHTNATDGRYFAKGNRVFKAPLRREDRGPNGERVFLTSFGFWVCDCNPDILGCAAIVAHTMQHEDKLRLALAKAIQTIRELTAGRSLPGCDDLQRVLDEASSFPLPDHTPPSQLEE